MSTKTIIVVAIIVLILGGWWWFASQQAPVPVAPGTQSTQNAPVTGQPAQNSINGVTTVSPTNSSDAALSQDLNNVDAQLNGLNADNASADSGLSNPNQ